MKFRGFADSATLEQEMCDLLTETFGQEQPRPHAVMLAGGGTPLAIYEALGRQNLRAGRSLHVMYSDDRLGPVTDPGSNYGNSQAMLAALRLPAERVIRVRGELAPGPAAQAYGDQLADFAGRGGTFALGVLGIGSDGHTASLFSLAAAQRTDRLTLAVERPDFLRVSVTRSVLSRFHHLVILATGEGKREILETLRDAPESIPSGVALAGLNVEVWTDLVIGDRDA